MRGAILAALSVGILLTGCSEQADVNRAVAVQAIDLQGKAARCLPASEMGVSIGGSELTGDLRKRLLSTEALAAGVRIFRETSNVTTYGSQTLYYSNAQANCVLWMEGLTLQEYGQRLGLNPIGLSPFYEVEKAKPVVPPVTPTAADTPVLQESGRRGG